MAILVFGLGRCSSSLVMQMLAAGGATAVGTYPAFEESVTFPGRLSAQYLKSLPSDAAIKVLDAQRHKRSAF